MSEPLPATRPDPEGTAGADGRESPHQTLVEIVVPVYNEERALDASVRRLHAFLEDAFPFRARILIADNASTDGTWPIALGLTEELAQVRAVRLERKGRGRALRHCWSESRAGVVGYMDVDLSTDLRALLPLVAPLVSGHSDVAIGSRLTPGSRVVRGPKREVISRGYNLLLRTAMGARFTDAQCGFKAVRADAARVLLPRVEDNAWFFDTELLLRAQTAGLRIHEVPVDWTDDPDSRVDIASTVLDDLKGMGRIAAQTLRRRPNDAPAGRVALPAGMGRQLPVFTIIGVVSTLVHLVLFWLLQGFWPAALANAAALTLCAVANNAANRRFTFGVTGRTDLLRHHLAGGAVFALTLALSTGALLALHTLAPAASAALELVAVVSANAVATVARFALLRGWVFHPARTAARTPSPELPSRQEQR